MNHLQGSALVKRRIVECHYCEYSCQKVQSNMAKCCIKRCNKHFCIQCIIQHFNKEFTMDMYKKDTWICFCCQETCDCDKCKSYQLASAQKIKKKRGPKSNKIQQQNLQEIQKQIENKSAKNSNENNEKSQLLEFDLSKQLYSQPKEIQQFEHLQEYKLYQADQMILFPAHYRKRIAQKHQFCNFVVKAYRQSKLKKDQHRKDVQHLHKQINSSSLFQEKPVSFSNLLHEMHYHRQN